MQAIKELIPGCGTHGKGSLLGYVNIYYRKEKKKKEKELKILENENNYGVEPTIEYKCS